MKKPFATLHNFSLNVSLEGLKLREVLKLKSVIAIKTEDIRKIVTNVVNQKKWFNDVVIENNWEFYVFRLTEDVSLTVPVDSTEIVVDKVMDAIPYILSHKNFKSGKKENIYNF